MSNSEHRYQDRRQNFSPVRFAMPKGQGYETDQDETQQIQKARHANNHEDCKSDYQRDRRAQ